MYCKPTRPGLQWMMVCKGLVRLLTGTGYPSYACFPYGTNLANPPTPHSPPLRSLRGNPSCSAPRGISPWPDIDAKNDICCNKTLPCVHAWKETKNYVDPLNTGKREAVPCPGRVIRILVPHGPGPGPKHEKEEFVGCHRCHRMPPDCTCRRGSSVV